VHCLSSLSTSRCEALSLLGHLACRFRLPPLRSFEGSPPGFFRNRTFSRDDFEGSVGKTVTVEASRARDGSMSGLIRQVTLADGRVVSACPQNC
jgi:hypothetical protein